MCLVFGGLAQDVLLRVAGRAPSQHEDSNSCLHHVIRMSSPAQMEGTGTEGEDSWPHFATHKAHLPRTLVYSSSTAPMTGEGWGAAVGEVQGGHSLHTPSSHLEKVQRVAVNAV